MHRRTITAVSIALWLSMMALGIAVAQPRTPLAGIPHMSDEPDGPEMVQFPPGTDKVYLVFDYESDSPVEIIAEVRSDSQQGAVLFTSRESYEGTGTANIEIDGPGDSSFPADRYTTIIRFRFDEGEQLHPTAGWEWVVGDVQLPADDASAGQDPFSSLDTRDTAGVDQSTQPNLDTTAGTDQSQTAAQTALPVQTTPGLSPIILVGLALVVVVLLTVIAWAVRGFMKAA